MANIMFPPKFHVDDATGAPLASGKVYFYEAGTSTPKDTYSDSGAVTPNANPLTLDSRGEATVYGVGSYKVVVKDSLDNTIYTVDNYSISGTVDTADIANGAVTTAKLATNALSADATGRAKMQDGFVTSAKLDSAGVALPSGSTATTQAAADNTTKVATTAFVQGEFTDKTASQSEMEAASSTTKVVTAGRVKYNPGVAKAWVVFQGRGTNGACTINGSSGVSGVSRTSGGVYEITFSTAFSGTNYAWDASTEDASKVSCPIATAKTASVLTLSLWDSYNSVVKNDPSVVCVTAFGDQ